MFFKMARNYRAWRVFDTQLVLLNKNIPCSYKLHVPPATLVRVFGPPCMGENISGTSGTYDFEDTNLDIFKVFDRHQTKESIDVKALNSKYPPFSLKGKTQNAPSIKEFWNSHLDAEFWVNYTDCADFDNFLKWIKEKIEKNEDLVPKLIEKYGEVDPIDKYHKKYQISRDYGLFKYNKIKWD
jgi:hypothetical protein